MSRRLFASALIATTGGVACTLLVDTSGYSGGSDAPDATPPADAATADGEADGGSDAKTDASPAAFCATFAPAPLVCIDFADPIDTAIFQPNIDPLGSLSLDDATFVSAPKSLLMTMSAPPADPCRYADYHRPINAPYAATQRVHFAFDVYLGDVSGSGGFPTGVAVNELRITAPGGAGDCGYYFDFGPSSASIVVEGAAGQPYALMPRPLAGQWNHVQLTIAGSKLGVGVNGGIALGATDIPAACQYGIVKYVSLGLLCVGKGEGPFNVHLDNAVVWLD